MSTDGATAQTHAPRTRRANRQTAPILLRLPDLKQPANAETAAAEPAVQHSVPATPHYGDTPPGTHPVSGAATPESHATQTATESNIEREQGWTARFAAWAEGEGGNVAMWIVIALLALALAAWVQHRTPVNSSPALPSAPASPASAQQLPRLKPEASAQLDNDGAHYEANAEHLALPGRPRITGLRVDTEPAPTRMARAPATQAPQNEMQLPTESSLSSRIERARSQPNDTRVTPTIHR